MKIAVITGATSGMGEEFARQISWRLHGIDEIWVFGRRKERLLQLQDKIHQKIRIFDGDLAEETTFERLVKALEQERPVIRILVNSAGFGKLGKTSDISIEDSLGMIEINCKALTRMTMLCMPYFRPGTRVILLASSAAFLPQPGFNIYAATKSYVLFFGRALRQELREKKVCVTMVCPGPVKTEFFDIAEEHAKSPFYKKLFYAEKQKVVEQALQDALDKKEVSVYGMPMKVFRVLCKMVPHSLILRKC